METNSEKEELQNSNEEIENSKQEETKDLKKTEEKKERKKISFKNINWMTVFKEIAYWVFVGILILFFDYLEFKTPEKLSATNYLSMDPMSCMGSRSGAAFGKILSGGASSDRRL